MWNFFLCLLLDFSFWRRLFSFYRTSLPINAIKSTHCLCRDNSLLFSSPFHLRIFIVAMLRARVRWPFIEWNHKCLDKWRTIPNKAGIAHKPILNLLVTQPFNLREWLVKSHLLMFHFHSSYNFSSFELHCIV